MTKTFCHLPFVHFALKPDGLAKPCCRFATYARGEQELRNWWNVNHNNIGSKNVLNSDEFASVREAMIEGKEVPGCWKCHNEEKTVGYSMRTFYNNKFLNHDRSVKLKYLEVGFGNYCNLSCRTCSSELSTSWYEDDVKLSKKYEGHAPHKKIIDIPFNWKSEDFEYIEEIKFVGGEPMLNPNFNKFLKTVLDTGNGKNESILIVTILPSVSLSFTLLSPIAANCAPSAARPPRPKPHGNCSGFSNPGIKNRANLVHRDTSSVETLLRPRSSSSANILDIMYTAKPIPIKATDITLALFWRSAKLLSNLLMYPSYSFSSFSVALRASAVISPFNFSRNLAA